MKKTAGLITIIDNDNFGNRLQNYASQEVLKKLGINIVTIKNDRWTNNKHSIKLVIKKIFIDIKSIFQHKNKNRHNNFMNFNKNITFSDYKITIKNYKKYLEKFDYCIVGSDQVWNPMGGGYRDLSNVELLHDIKTKKISFSSSFGISSIPLKFRSTTSQDLKKFDYISVREDRGKEIIEELTGRKDVNVLIDPTMALSRLEWEKVIKKPKMLKSSKYILNYFLGNLSPERKLQIENFAKKNEFEIIDILNPNSEFYDCGPSEFLYLEKNASLICTDSFHSSVFAIIFQRPFLVFEREDQLANMNSRLDTLLKKFKMENRKYCKKIEQKDLKCNYAKTNKILEEEQTKVYDFLIKALELKDSEINE